MKLLIKSLILALMFNASAFANSDLMAKYLGNANPNLSAEEQLKELFDQANGKNLDMSKYLGCLSGISIRNQNNWQKYSMAMMYTVSHAPQKARHLVLVEGFIDSTISGFTDRFSEDTLSGIFSCNQNTLTIKRFPRHHAEQTSTGTLLKRNAETVYEVREVEPGVVIALLPAKTENGIPGKCPWSNPTGKTQVISPEKRDRRGNLIKNAVTKFTQTGWGSKRPEYKLNNVCDIQMLYYR